MPVVLLDRRRPDVIPVRAIPYLTGPVTVTEDVPPATVWPIETIPAATELDDLSTTLLSSDPGHPLVRARIDRGDEVIVAAPVSGEALLDAVALMDALRRNGPWESTQTHESLRRYLLEEVYETLDAIDAGDPAELCAELGDLLLQILFHSSIAADDPEVPFDIDDVARSFVAKVTRRTQGVLSGAHADLETQIREWEEQKAAERQRGSILDGIATTAPALAMAQKVLERISSAGFPEDLIPDDITVVRVVPGDTSVEDDMRSAVVEFMNRIRRAEDRIRDSGGELNADAWRASFDRG